MKIHTIPACIAMMLLPWVCAQGRNVKVKANGNSDCTAMLQQAIDEVSKSGGGVVEMDFGIYHFSRSEAIQSKYHVSNTTSEAEDDDPTKHIALLIREAKNVTIDGNGSTIMLDGEMTTFVVDSSSDITLTNLTIDNMSPTQTEMTLMSVQGNNALMRVHPTSHYEIRDGKLWWTGPGWEFSGGISQTFDPATDRTWRDRSPMDRLRFTTELEPGLLWLSYDEPVPFKPGRTFQMRDAIRDEVCGLICNSRNVKLDNVNIRFAGNFGIVGQCSRNITMRDVRFEPEPGSGRTNVGFADFLQFSGCGGQITVEGCRFTGAHDDPINVHGTHLKLMRRDGTDKIVVRYMHPQTFGFQSFFRGDKIEIVDQNTLLPVAEAEVKDAKMISAREIEITLRHALPASITPEEGLVVENVTMTPDVTISRCYFSRIPTRGILVTTRGRVVIEYNTFYHMMMSAILIADDANSWYESGPVRDVTIRANRFIECGSPVINIHPEVRVSSGLVHRNISISDNIFKLCSSTDLPISAFSVDNMHIHGNIVETADIAEKAVSK